MDVNNYLSKQYRKPGCWLLVVDVYINELKIQIGDYTPERATLREIADIFRIELHKGCHGFKRVVQPTNFAVVLMGKLEGTNPHHAGVFYNGKVLHVLNDMNYYQDLYSLSDQYKQMEFWVNED